MTADASSDNSTKPRFGMVSWALSILAAALLGYLIVHSLHQTGGESEHVVHEAPPLWGVGSIPFVGILAAIAIFPLIPATMHWWESNRNRLLVSLAFSVVTLIYAFAWGGLPQVIHVLEHAIVSEYIPFIVLLFSLYVISGGINLSGDLPAHPATNTFILGIGAAAASVVGTTGASMLLIRPLLQTNSERKYVTHTVIFFIFLVSNIGGCLLPIGDPPLFLGYVRGVPFAWTFNLWKEWLFCCGMLLLVYWVWDSIVYKREPIANIVRDESVRRPLRLRGWINFVYLIGVVLAVWQLVPGQPMPVLGVTVFPFLRELALLGLVVLSLLTTPERARLDNRFNYTAIIEVAALFIGIFITMQIPIAVLDAVGDRMGLSQPWQFFWATGLLSSFLDNAPTYVVFFEAASALTHGPGEGVFQLLGGQYIRQDLLVAISLGAVFMGANTYIGNGPNFMVKSIAEQMGVQMPSFFGYIVRFSLPILIPLFILVMLLFM